MKQVKISSTSHISGLVTYTATCCSESAGFDEEVLELFLPKNHAYLQNIKTLTWKDFEYNDMELANVKLELFHMQLEEEDES
jgi:hypothetical protein